MYDLRNFVISGVHHWAVRWAIDHEKESREFHAAAVELWSMHSTLVRSLAARKTVFHSAFNSIQYLFRWYVVPLIMPTLNEEQLPF